jgi:hypothetical protein
MDKDTNVDDPSEFSVWKFTALTDYELACTYVKLSEATQVAVKATNEPGIIRVIMTAGKGQKLFEWAIREGVVFPPKLKGMHFNVKTPQPGPDEALENFAPRHARRDSGVLPVRPAPWQTDIREPREVDRNTLRGLGTSPEGGSHFSDTFAPNSSRPVGE